jgi:exodeoxyribonuclease VII small subunit
MSDQAPKMGFEEAFARLEVIVRQLETAEIKLDDALRLFEEGVTLSRLCTQLLDKAEARVQVLVANAEGEPEVEEFENPPPGVA